VSNQSLRLQVVFAAIDKLTGPLKKIIGDSSALGKTFKATHDRLKELKAQQKDVGRFRELRDGLGNTSSKLREAQQQVALLAQRMQQTTNPTRAMTREFNAAVAAASALKRAGQEQSTQLQTLRTRLSSAGISTRNLASHERTLRTEVAAANAQLTVQQQKLAAVTRQQEKLSRLRNSFGKSKEMAGQLGTVGATSGALGGGLLLGAKSMITPGVEFNAAMSRVQALSRIDKQSPAFAQLRQQSRDLGASTSFTATEAAQGQGYLAMAGFKPEQILQSMPTVLSVAKAGGADLGRTADIASDILTSFGLEADQMQRVGDVLTMTFTSANTNLEMLGETMKYVGPVAKAAGMSLEQASAMAGLLGNAGIKSSQAGTTLRSMLLRLGAPTSKAADALKELSISARDAKGNVRDLPTMLRDVAEATKAMGTGDRLGYLKQIFGEEPAAGMAELIHQQGSAGIERYVDIVKHSQGVAQQTAAVMADNLQGDLQTMKSAWEDLGITLSDTVDTPLRAITSRITDITRAASQWAQQNPVLTATLFKIALVLGAVLAVLGIVTLALATILVPLAAVKFSLGLLGVQGGLVVPILKGIAKAVGFVASGFLRLGMVLLTNPIVLAIAAIALAVGVAAYLIYKHWEPIKVFFTGMWDKVKQAFSGGILGITALVLNWSPLGMFYKAFAGVMSWFGVELPATFTGFGQNIIKGLMDGIASGYGMLKDKIKQLGSMVGITFAKEQEIRSPSRVFQRFGGFMTEGLALGIEHGGDAPLQQVGRLARRLTQLGAGLAIGTTLPALAVDQRPPMTPRMPGSGMVVQGDTIQITIEATPGADPQAIARAVAAELDRRDRQKAARLRSGFADY